MPKIIIIFFFMLAFGSFCLLFNMYCENKIFAEPVKYATLNDPKLKVEVVFSGINFPTSMAFLGPDDILVLEKNNGTVQRIVNGTLLPKPILDVNVANEGERGMLGIAIAKHENNSPYVLLYYTESVNVDGDDLDEGLLPIGNRLYRYELVDNSLINPKLLLDLPVTRAPSHNGGKIVIGPDENIYLVTGDLDAPRTRSQNLKNGSNPDGSSGILYLRLDGSVVNPLIGIKDPLNKYYAYGLRNSFGLAFDPITGKLWDTENGPGYGDEINLVEPSFNSGWIMVQGIWKSPVGGPFYTRGDIAMNPSRSLTYFDGKGKYSSPEFTWERTVGPTGITFLSSNRLGSNYENDLFVGDFHNGNIYHFDLDKKRTGLLLKGQLADKLANNTSELKQVTFAKGFGGITDIQVGPDGNL